MQNEVYIRSAKKSLPGFIIKSCVEFEEATIGKGQFENTLSSYHESKIHFYNLYDGFEPYPDTYKTLISGIISNQIASEGENQRLRQWVSDGLMDAIDQRMGSDSGSSSLSELSNTISADLEYYLQVIPKWGKDIDWDICRRLTSVLGWDFLGVHGLRYVYACGYPLLGKSLDKLEKLNAPQDITDKMLTDYLRRLQNDRADFSSPEPRYIHSGEAKRLKKLSDHPIRTELFLQWRRKSLSKESELAELISIELEHLSLLKQEEEPR